MSGVVRYPSGEVYLPVVLLLVVLFVCIAIYRLFKKLEKHETSFTHVLDDSKRLEVAEQEVRLENLESRIELIISLILEIKGQLHQINTVFASREVKGISQYEEIYQAFDQGKDIGELVRQFGRDKGEIELILNLRKASS
jgi:hypothetical protein